MQDTKKVAGELLVELEKKGVTFETVDGKLKYKDSKGNFTENSKEKVKKYKEEIIEILKKKQTIDEFITDNDYETNVYPLTDVQAAYLVGKTEAVKWGGIGCKGYIEVDFGSYSAEELSRAWKVLVNRHEMLRAKVTEVGFEILERDEIDYEIKIVNLQKMAEREKVDTLSKIREDFSEYVFHTEEPPLFKVLITKRIEGNFFHLLVDLIVSDFASVQLLISEMGELLKGASLEKIRYKFSDYAMFNQQRKGIDILGCALGGLSTWKLGNVAESYTTSMAGGGNRVISGIIGMVPVTFIVNTNVDRNDIDHPLHLYHRIELTFSTGRLCLVNTHGPVIWLPFLHMPRDEYGTLSINVEEEVNIPSGVTIGNVMLPSVKETFEQIWPDAVKKALEILFKQNRTEKMSMAQYQIYVSKLWSEICQKVGYMNIVDYDNFGDIKSIFYDLEKRHLIKKENDGIE